MDADTEELFLLWAARETGLLDALLTSADTPETAAVEADVTERAATVTVEALAERGFLREVDGAYEPTNRALGLLAQRDVRSIGTLPHRLDRLTNWAALPETMGGADPPIDHPSDRPRQFAGAGAATRERIVRACVTAAVHAAPTATRVLDVGGNGGAFAMEFADRGYEVTLADRSDALAVVDPLLSGLSVNCFEARPGEPLPGGFDLGFCAHRLHRLSSAESQALLGSVHDALAPGGTVVVIGHIQGRSDDAAMARVRALAQTSGGDVPDEATLREWIETAGFEDIAVEDVPGTPYRAVVGRRPE